MDDEDVAAPPKIDNDAAELGNLSNQVGNLSKNMQDLSGQRGQAEQQISQTSQQKQAFQERLTQLRSAYDQEVAQVKALKDRLSASQAETKRLQQDMAMTEGLHADLVTQHQQLATAFAADQQENASLKERISQTNAENEQLKPQIEKLKSEARQQKGRVAINKKQLMTNETEHERLQAEIAATQHEIELSRREAEETARQAEQSQREVEQRQRDLEQSKREHEQAKREALPAPVSRELSPPPQIVSPSPSANSNPFFRRQDSSAIFSPPMGSTITSPVSQHENDRNSAFDAIFGPSIGHNTEPPSTSFSREAPAITETHPPETPALVEPPPPAPESQIDSSALPLRGAPLLRDDSMSSSVKVAPPASRLSPAETPRPFTPDTSTASPVSQKADDTFALSAADEEQESVRRSVQRGTTMEKLENLPGAFPGSRSDTPAPSDINPATVALGAGAATIAAGAGLAAAASSQSTESQPATETKDNFDDFFGGPSHKKTLSEQHADFDSAFASMDTQPQSAKPAAPSQEFPDIQELDDDDDDDDSSDDDSDAKGFDDNFISMSSKAAGKQPEVPTSEAGTLSVLRPPPFVSVDSTTSLPPVDSQQSPPTYKEVVPADNPNHFPREYKNLLPEREDPTSPPLPTAGGSTFTGPNPAGSPPTYGPEVGSPTQSRSVSHAEIAAPPPTKAAPFDFDSAFTNLGTAPVADESDSDYDDATPGKEKNHSFDFNSTFDSPAASTRTTSTVPPSFSAHNAVTSPAPITTNGTTASSPTGPAQTGFASFDEFNSNPFPPSRTGTLQSQQTTSPASAAANNTTHDWDTLFAPLSSQPAPVSSESRGFDESLAGPMANKGGQQATEIGAGLTAVTTHEETSDVTPTHSAAQVPSVSVPTGPAATQSSSLKPERPQPGRALSAGTEHDDPILKRLTAMGWSRQDALDALEKFDYNLDKVSATH